MRTVGCPPGRTEYHENDASRAQRRAHRRQGTARIVEVLHRILRDDHVERPAVQAIREACEMAIAPSGRGDESQVLIEPRHSSAILSRYGRSLIPEAAPEI